LKPDNWQPAILPEINYEGQDYNNGELNVDVDAGNKIVQCSDLDCQTSAVPIITTSIVIDK
jgi:hypothetical protein